MSKLSEGIKLFGGLAGLLSLALGLIFIGGQWEKWKSIRDGQFATREELKAEMLKAVTYDTKFVLKNDGLGGGYLMGSTGKTSDSAPNVQMADPNGPRPTERPWMVWTVEREGQ